MSGVVEIFNRALTKLGQSLIQDPEQNVKNAKVLNEMWPRVRNAVLRMHPWNFAIVRISLAQEGTDPLWGFAAQYVLPADYLWLVEIENNPEHKIENGRILTDETGAINIRYVQVVSDTSRYDELFIEAVASKLAFEAAESLTQSNTEKQQAEKDLDAAMKLAKRRDGQEGSPRKFIEQSWLIARR